MSLLRISTPAGDIDTGDDISIPLVLKSPLFNDADGSYSYNFQLPATDKLVINGNIDLLKSAWLTNVTDATDFTFKEIQISVVKMPE